MSFKRTENQQKTTQKKPIIIANWKSSTLTYTDAEKKIKDIYKGLQKNISKIDLTIAPTVSHIAMLSGYFGGKFTFNKKKSKTKGKKVITEKLPKIVLASQDISIYKEGSHTGEVSVKSIKDAGATKVILGHSECRERGDTLDMIITKVKLAIDEKMQVILCIGEKQRDEGVNYLKTIDEQITSVFNAINPLKYNQIIIAYEPVWAINNKDNLSLDAHGLHSMVVYIRKLLSEKYGEALSSSMKILYGGSVNKDNAQDIYWNGEVQGLLIGRSSFEPKNLLDVISEVLINPKKNILKTYGIYKKNT